MKIVILALVTLSCSYASAASELQMTTAALCKLIGKGPTSCVKPDQNLSWIWGGAYDQAFTAIFKISGEYQALGYPAFNASWAIHYVDPNCGNAPTALCLSAAIKGSRSATHY